MPKADDGLVTVYPKRLTFIEGVPHREQRVTATEARRLTDWMGGAAFTTDPTDPERLLPPEPTPTPDVAAQPAPQED